MGSPAAHVSLLPSAPKPRYACDSCSKTFVSVRNRHEHLLRYSHSVNQTIKITVPFYLNLRQQNIKCPLCKFKAKGVKTPRSFITHFTRHLGQYQLEVAHTCTICTEVMTDKEVHDHLLRHQRERIPLTPNTTKPSADQQPPTPSTPTSSSNSSPTSSVSSHDLLPESCDMDPASQPPCSPATMAPQEVSPPSQPIFSPSSPIPDTQNPFSPPQPSPERFSPSTSDAALMRLFLNSCEETGNIPPPNLPLSDTSIQECPDTPLNYNLLPNTTSQQPTSEIPPLMAKIIATPNPLPRHPVQTNHPRPMAADFFEPVMENLPSDDSTSSHPPRRPSSPLPRLVSLPTTTDTSLRPPSPLQADPATITFPTTDSANSLHSFRQCYLRAFDADLTFEHFEMLTTHFSAETVELARDITSQRRPKPAPRRPDRPSARPPIDHRRPTTDDPTVARRLQTLYRLSKKRAARKIFGDKSPGFDGTLDDATTFFTQTFGSRDCDLHQLQAELSEHIPSLATDDSLFVPPTPEELAHKLRSFSNSAPGQDRLEYRHLRLLDPRCEILSHMFSHCFKAKDVPAHWKSATTILINKKNSTNDPSNFRPIALMSCLYKLLMSILARRMTNHAITNDLLSAEQKSARPSEGCYEHAFLLESIVNDARRQPRPLSIAWLDIKNAFGSIPHSALLTTLTHMGFPADLVELIRNAYTDATTEVVTPLGKTPPIPIHSGVKQGCPLSAILFNLALELILRRCKAAAAQLPCGPLKHHGLSFSVLAYADDLVILARNPRDLQVLLDAVSSAANTLSLSFRPDKCASLSMAKQAPRIQPDQFYVQHNPIPMMNREDHYLYLGVPIGLVHNVTNLSTLIDELTTKLTKIENSLLAPWQKLDAIRTFVQPCLTYALLSTDPTTKSLEAYRAQLIRTVRAICSLPTRATTHYIFAAKHAGGLGLTDPLTENHLQTVVQALKMLSSTDPAVAAVSCFLLVEYLYLSSLACISFSFDFQWLCLCFPFYVLPTLFSCIIIYLT